MSDLIGRTLGHYRITAKIGEGGMGEVYLARDERLDREVAIKVLHEKVAGVQDRLERFEREAKLLASLNHSNIATLHGLEEQEGHRFLVMELVEGESLASFITRGAISLDEALPIALQIAAALETAHEHGIIHRDLKPANVMLGSEGEVKVLDFGLAKAFDPTDSPPQSPESLAESPTLTAEMTRAGVLLGTAPYMSPEQARGKPVDRRADIWAFGCTLFEMLTGRRPFGGTSSTDVLAAVIKEDVNWDLLPGDTLIPLRRLLQRCLTKDPRDRLHDIADARIELQSISTGDDCQYESATSAPARTVQWWRPPWFFGSAVGFGAGLLLAGLLYWNFTPDLKPQAVTRFDFFLPPDQHLYSGRGHSLSLSPDGNRLVYAANGQLFLLQLDSSDLSPIRGTNGFDLWTRSPAFSPEGDHVVFWADRQLRKIDIDGGTPKTLCEVSWPLGVSWGVDDQILFGQGSEGIWKVSANGGRPERLISVDAENLEAAHGPQLLPNGNSVLFTLNTGRGWDNAQIVVQSLETGDRRLLIDGGTDARYISTGHLIFVQENTLFATPFDSAKLEISRERIPLGEKIEQERYGKGGASHLAISKTGTLAYEPASVSVPLGRLVWVDREGSATPVIEDKENFGFLSLSPDGRRAAVAITEGSGKEIWIFDLQGERPPYPIRRGGCSWVPVWTPDSRQVIFAFSETPNTTEDLYRFSADGKDDEPKILLSRPGQQFPYAVSADGSDLFFFDLGIGETPDIWVLDTEGNSEPRPLFDTEFEERHAATSPDMRWIAFTSNRTGRREVWIASYPDLQQRQLVSSEGGTEPRWSDDGRELYYWAGYKMMAVAVDTSKSRFSFETPRALFEGQFLGRGASWPSYGVASDGRFLMIQRADPPTSDDTHNRIRIVLNLFEELRRLAPTD